MDTHRKDGDLYNEHAYGELKVPAIYVSISDGGMQACSACAVQAVGYDSH